MNSRAEFSTLEVAVLYAMHLPPSTAKLTNLELKTRPKQLLSYLPIDVTVLPATSRWHGSVIC